MTAQPILQLQGVTKYFCREAKRARRYGLIDLANECNPFAQPRRSARPGEFPAIEDISLVVLPGEAVAILGLNGAGKTTLMRMIAEMIKPDRGELSVRGRVNSVIELGQGLNPQLTGRENAELGLAWRGISRIEAEKLIPLIADFAELDDAFDGPIGTYSSGMRMRLAFAIAVHVPCQLLLLDEVLAVGDLRFQKKCIKAIQTHLHHGGSIILVSHSIPQVLSICQRGLLLKQGRLAFDGDIGDAVELLLDWIEDDRAHCAVPVEVGSDARIVVLSARGIDGGALRTGMGAVFEIELATDKPITVLTTLSIRTRSSSVCVTASRGRMGEVVQAGVHRRRCVFERLDLMRGTYDVHCSMLGAEDYLPIATFGYKEPPLKIEVLGEVDRIATIQRGGGQLVHMPSHWDIIGADGKAESNSGTVPDQRLTNHAV